MEALVVYESMWGNTEEVARAVARGLGGARVVEVGAATEQELEGVELLVVGGPTHAFSMSRASTRRDAHQKGAPRGGEEVGVREWLGRLPERLEVPIATFDTRVAKVAKLPGSAAKGAERELRRHHRGRVVARESFYVEDMAGPLVRGELERAEAWGRALTDVRVFG